MTNPSVSFGHGYLTDMNDLYASTVYTVTAAGGDTVHCHCTTLTQANDYWNGAYIKFLTGDNAGLSKAVTDFLTAGDELQFGAFPNTCDVGDTFVLSNWFLSDSGLGGVLTQVNDDVFQIDSSPDVNTNEYTLWEYPNPNGTTHLTDSSGGALYTNKYTTYYVRYKASGTLATGVGARVQLVFTGGDTQYIVGNAAPALTANKWVVATGTILYDLTHQVIEHVRIIADDNPDSTAAGPYVTSFDYILLCQGTFTFPNCETSTWEPNPAYAISPMPSKSGSETQNLGSESGECHCTCNLDLSNGTDDWRRPQGNLDKNLDAVIIGQGDYIAGQVFDEIAHMSYTEPWQWLNTGKGRQFKAILKDPIFNYPGEKHTVELLFIELRRGSASTETYVERYGLNI
jgi:hypothetical protein